MSLVKLKPGRDVEYPDSDGKPMAESDVHRDWMVAIIQRLKGRYAGRRVYVSGNLFIYYVEGDPKKCVAPDGFVVKNCSPRRRRVFKTWEEKRVPNFILETTSKKTRREDLGWKKELYKELCVAEYFLYDPMGEWLKPPLQGFRLVDGDYEPIAGDAEGGVVSEELGIRFIVRDGELLMFDAVTGELVLTAEEQRTREAEQRARRLEVELARLRESIKKTNGRRGKNGK